MCTTHASRCQPDPINLHLQFLQRTVVGPAAFKVKDVKLGSRISNLHIALSQEGRGVVEGYITMSNLAKENGLSLPTHFQLHPPVLPVDLALLSSQGEDLNWVRRRVEAFPIFRRAGMHIEIHLEKPERRPQGRPRSILDQWVRFTPYSKPGKWTNDALGYLIDMFPQIVESYINADRGELDLQENPATEQDEPRPKLWYPTMSLNLDVKGLLPPEGVEWVFVRAQAKVINRGRMDLLITVLDTEHHIVALSTHSALILDALRNTATGQKKRAKM